jgi:hypothetical protein
MIEAHASMKRIYLLILVLSGCPFVLGPGASARSLGDGKLRGGEADDLVPYVGLYQGSFRSAVETPWPDDDLNLNPCIIGRQDCDVHQAPLADIFIRLSVDAERRPRLRFFYTREDVDQGRVLDLLGLGCGSEVREAVEFARANKASTGDIERRWRITFRLYTGQCRIGSSQSQDRELDLVLGQDAAGAPVALVQIFRGLRDANYLYTMEDGERRRVRIMSPTVHGGGRGFEGKYVCVEDAMGEYPQSRCTHVIRTREGFAVPLPTGDGGMSVLFGANTKYSIDLERTTGEYDAEHYTARFERVPE